MVRIFELNYYVCPGSKFSYENEGNYFNQIYYIVITLTSVGYGDISPQTFPGKIIIIFVAFLGSFILSLVVLVTSNVFSFTKEQ